MTYCEHCMREIKNENTRFCPYCGKDPVTRPEPHHLPPGTVLSARYRLGAVLGEGGFGITYIGKDLKLDDRVAVKEFYPIGYVTRTSSVSPVVSAPKDESKLAFINKEKSRFLQEARTLAKFTGEPGIVDVRDYFESNGTVYIVMEFLEGETLKARIRRDGALPPEETLRLLTPVMSSLGALHKQGVIHRDISPDNIMLTGHGVKLLDFGAARSVENGANKSLSVLLKPGYAPVEQYRSHGAQGPWTDVYGLCATIYRCITGRHPPEATDRIWDDPLQLPSALGVKVSPAFEDVLMKGLAVKAEERIQTVDALQAAFEAAARAPDKPVADTAEPADDEWTSFSENPAPRIKTLTAEKAPDRTEHLQTDDPPEIDVFTPGDELPTVGKDTPATGEEAKPEEAKPEEALPMNAADGAEKKQKLLLGIIAGAIALLLLTIVILAIAYSGGKEGKSGSKATEETGTTAAEETTAKKKAEATTKAAETAGTTAAVTNTTAAANSTSTTKSTATTRTTTSYTSTTSNTTSPTRSTQTPTSPPTSSSVTDPPSSSNVTEAPPVTDPPPVVTTPEPTGGGGAPDPDLEA